MSQLKIKADVVMLPYHYSKAPKNQHFIAVDGRNNRLVEILLFHLDKQYQYPVHFYLLSECDIKVGDIVMNKFSKQVFQISSDDIKIFREMRYHEIRKIEATNDFTIKENYDVSLPTIPPAFIEKFLGKPFNVRQVNIDAELLLGNIKDVNNPKTSEYTPVVRENGTVILSKINPQFTYEDMVKAYKYGRFSKDTTFSDFGKTAEEFIRDEFNYLKEEY